MPRLLPERLISALRSGPVSSTAPEPAFDATGDVVRESRIRIRIAALVGAFAYFAFLVFEWSGVLVTSPLERRIDLAHDVVGLALCSGLLLLAMIHGLGQRTLFVAALTTQVLLCVAISIAVPWAAFVRTAFVPAITWVVPVVILFPLLVPSSPRTTIVVSALCAWTMPAGQWWLDGMGLIDVHGADLLATGLTGGVGAVIAVVASNTVYAARREAAAARRAGSYDLLERMAQGGMGEIWKARHAMLARPAAVKLIHADILRKPSEERDAFSARFTREAQVTASLRSPHTVELFDFGVSADGRFYYAMELLEGMNAEHLVYRFGPLPPRRAVAWLRQVCHSLAEAHALGLVHRDIKPGNLMVCRRGRDVDVVKVLDFGLTRPVIDTDQQLTRPGVRLGTPGYMSPEQVFGMEVDARSDIYALGCVGYWLIAGRKPFESDSPGELLKLHAGAPPPRLSELMGATAPAPLETLLLACLAKEPPGRPQNADELDAALAECLGGDVWTHAEAQEWWATEMP